MASAMTKRLAADAWQHLLAGNLFDFSRDPKSGEWLVHVEPVTVAKGQAPFGDADRAIGGDEALAALLRSLPPHGQPVIVPRRVLGPMMSDITAVRAFFRQDHSPSVYPELAGTEATAPARKQRRDGVPCPHCNGTGVAVDEVRAQRAKRTAAFTQPSMAI